MDKQGLVRNISYGILLLSLTACGGGGGSSTPAPAPTPTSPPVSPPATPPVSVSGGGVKGPLANAVVTVYAFDASQPGFKGSVTATASTDANAAITGLALPSPVAPPYIMEFTSTPGASGTTDITTGQFPVITTLRTVITQALLDGGDPLYATPLTTMAVDIAVSNAADTNGTAGIQADEFEAALAVAASQVVSTLGFGLNSSVDIFDTPPLVDNTTTSTQQQTDVAAYRAAVEAVTAIAFQINQQSSGGDTDSVLTELADDLADGNGIDGSAGSQINASTLQVLQQDPATLPIPNSPTNQTVADVQTILVSEASTTAPSTPVTALDAGGSISTIPAAAETNPDSDGDGVLNADDAFPNDSSESVDSDGDGIGDNADPDDDNNGILDVDEGATPVPAATDVDVDGVDDVTDDNCPTVFNPSQTNTDGDTEGDACDVDDDNDGTDDAADAFPLDASESIDTDSDGIGNVADTDDDNDGVLDINDTGVSPLDGTACSLLIDCDGDGVFDSADFDPVDATVTINFPPVVTNDAVTVLEDAAMFSIDVTANDTDVDGNPNDTVTLVSIGTNDATKGTAVINGNSVDYTPVADASGSDTFSYTVTDGTVTSTGSVTVTLTAVNDAPMVGVVGPFNINEDAINAASVGVVTATDVDGVITGFAIASGNTANAFAITANGLITVNDTTAIDFETVTSFTLAITATDGTAISASQDVTININDVNDTAPVVGAVGPFNIDENAANATLVGTPVSATDADTVGAVTGFMITGGNTGQAFAINTVSGQLSVNNTAAIDFETATSFILTIAATDGINVSTGVDVIVNINDVNDTAPVVTAAQTFAVAEDAANAAVVATVLATDTDGAVTGFTITGGNTGVAFAIDATGQITVNDATAIDFETATSFSLLVTATDGINTSVAETVTINVSDVNDTAPVVTAAQSFNVAANATVIGMVTATDIDTVGAITGFAITAGDGGELVIDNSGQISVIAPLTVVAGSSYSLTVTATDGTNTSTGETVTVNVVSNTPPVFDQTGPLLVTMDEDSNGFPADVPAPVISATDVDGDTLTWSTVGAANGFAETGFTGNSPSQLNYTPYADFNGVDSFVVNVSDGTTTVGITIEVTVNPINDAPTITGSPATTATEGGVYSFTPSGGDVDGDTLTYSISGQPAWTTVSFDTATGQLTGTPAVGESGIYNNIVISVTDGNSPPVALPAFSITVGSGIDLTGVWNLTFTSDPASDLPSAGCSGNLVGDTENMLVAIKQTGTSLEMMIDGNQLAGGTIDVTSGDFNLSGLISYTVANLLDTDAPQFENVTTSETVTFVATGTTGGSITGTVTSDDGACTAFDNITASFVYRPTGAENYDGVYAFELSSREESSNNPGVIDTYNEAFPFELEVVGNTLNVYFPDEVGPNETESISANTFDPVTGYFTFTSNYTEKQDNDPNIAGFEFSLKETLIINGFFVGDPATTPGGNGSPIVFMSAKGTTYEYTGDFDNGGLLSSAYNSSDDIYGKRLITTGSTRTRMIEKGDQTSVMTIRLGLQSPPLKRQDVVNSDLYLQVFDGASLLCEGPFADDGTGSFLYYEQINQPDPDFAARQFRSGPYSTVNCNTSLADGTDQVVTGATYTIRILDTGTDGVKGTADDAIMFDSDVDFAGGYQAEVAAPADRYTQAPNVFDIKVNGAKASTTMGGRLLPLYGYFDESEAISVSWPAQEAVTDNYQVRLRAVGDFINNRYATSATNIQLPAFALNEYDATSLKLVATGAAAGTPNAKAMSVSRALEIQRGVRGLFNIELGNGIPAEYRTMQLYLEGSDFGLAACMVTNNPLLTCSGGSVDFNADTVTLNMSDSMGVLGTAGSFTLVLHFKPDNVAITSARAVVTSPDEAGIPAVVDANPALWTTAARAVNSELEIRSQRLSNGSFRTLVVGINPVANVYDKAIFKSDTTTNIFTNDFSADTDTLTTSRVIWDEFGGIPFAFQLSKFTVVPTDDNKSQYTGSFTLDSTVGWGYGSNVVLKPDTYRAVLIDTDTAEPNIVFRKSYAGNDPSAYVSPTINDVKVDVAGTVTACSQSIACEAASAVDTSSNGGGFNLEWTVPTPPANSRWRLIATNLTTGAQERTNRLIPDDIGPGSEITSVDNGDMTTTYTWVNPGDIVAPASGDTLEINIMITSGEKGTGFANVGVMITADRVHVVQTAALP